MNNLVSIIMPLYNSGKFIEQSIKSVLTQTYKDWELIIIDDCSSDNSNDIVKKYIKKDNRIKFIKLDKNSGASIARNEGIKIAKGRYITFLDSDDLWLPHKLEIQINFMIDNDLAFTYSSYKLINENGENIGEFITKPEITYNSMLKTCNVGCLTAMYDAGKLGKIYMPNIKKREDYATWIKILQDIKFAKGISQTLAIYRVYNKSVSANKLEMSKYQWNFYRQELKLNLISSMYYFINYAIYGFLKYK